MDRSHSCLMGLRAIPTSYTLRERYAEAKGVSAKDVGELHRINLDRRDNRLENTHEFDGHTAHVEAHMSLKTIVLRLIRDGAITFNSTTGLYEYKDFNNEGGQ